MKKLIGLLVICFAFSLSAVAQHGGHQGGGGRPEVGGGHQNIPKHGPAKVTTPHAAEENRVDHPWEHGRFTGGFGRGASEVVVPAASGSGFLLQRGSLRRWLL